MNSGISHSDWDLLPGDAIKRTELTQRFGGSGQGGINPSRTTPNVLLFTDPLVGEVHGYNYDRRDSDGAWNYTGEGQHGDQTLRAGNKAIYRHREDERTLRLFQGSRGSVLYLGAFELDSSEKYRIERAPETDGGPTRNVIVFKLRPIDADNITQRNNDDEIVSDVEVEQQNTDSMLVRPVQESIEAQRREALLVKRFKVSMKKHGYTVRRKRLKPPGVDFPLFTDLYITNLHLLIEAKGTSDRVAFRMAIGQLADYRRFLNSPRCAILLPSRPHEDLITLARVESISVYWETQGGFMFMDPEDATAGSTDKPVPNAA